MQERLCQSCVQEGLKGCWFITKTKERIKALPSPKNQTPIIVERTIATKEALEANKNIANDRILARDERLCPQVNYQSFDPKFIKNF